jgi:hypothetical protein
LSKRVHESRVYLNDREITDDVYGVELKDIPNSLLMAKVELYVRSVGTEVDENGRVRVVYRLGSEDRCPGCGEPADDGPHGPNQGYGGCV